MSVAMGQKKNKAFWFITGKKKEMLEIKNTVNRNEECLLWAH